MSLRSSTHPALSSLALPPSAPAAARAVCQLLKQLRHGTLVLQMPDGTSAHFGTLAEGEPRAGIS
ncbi:MAG: hypothetical protein JNM26_00390, partial [Ideonella sp.]|nr:hypothetical protein [Ideonella sp.]